MLFPSKLLVKWDLKNQAYPTQLGIKSVKVKILSN